MFCLADCGWIRRFARHYAFGGFSVAQSERKTAASAERGAYMGSELRDRTLGVIGIGGIGGKLVEMIRGFGMRPPIAHDPFASPAQVHDFDESICIIHGIATCVVEGRRHQLTDCTTALLPRGRVHCLVNEGTEAMAMIWVSAGPAAERLIVEERCATADGNPWKTPIAAK